MNSVTLGAKHNSTGNTGWLDELHSGADGCVGHNIEEMRRSGKFEISP